MSQKVNQNKITRVAMMVTIVIFLSSILATPIVNMQSFIIASAQAQGNSDTVALCVDTDGDVDCDEDDVILSSPCAPSSTGEKQMSWPNGNCVPENCSSGTSRASDGSCKPSYDESNICSESGTGSTTPTTAPTKISAKSLTSIKLITLTTPTNPSKDDIFKKLSQLGDAAQRESPKAGVEGRTFKAAVDDFAKYLETNLNNQATSTSSQLPANLQLIMKALELWTTDPGNKWGSPVGVLDKIKGSFGLLPPFSSKDPRYASVPASQDKCNIFVAELIYDIFGLDLSVIPSEKEKGKYFPYQAKQWADKNQPIPHFPVTESSNAQPGDIWAIHDSLSHHVGIYLGKYNGVDLYISARSDSFGVFGLNGVQQNHGIQIKSLPAGGTFRHYTP